MLIVKFIYIDLFILILIYLKLSHSDIDYCEASSLIDTTKSGIFSYPIELFKYKGRSNKINNDKLFNCNSSAIGNPIFHCSPTTLACPIDSIDLEEMSRKTKEWNYKHSLCALVSKKQKNDVKRLIIFGGSVTGGRSAYGCFCLESLGNKCPYVSKAHQSEEETTESDCRWGYHVARWFKSSFPNTKVYILSKGGVGSTVMVDLFERKFMDLNIQSLNSNDIIILDHSVNDATSLRGSYTGTNYIELQQGLELFVRKLFYYAEPESIPTIILNEFWPYNDADISLESLSLYNYSDIYYTVASVYQIPLLSYRDLVWSKAIETKYDNYTVEMFKFHKSSNLRHPPWMVHLYYADLITAFITKEIKSCKENKNNEHTLTISPFNNSKFIRPFGANDRLESYGHFYMLSLQSSVFLDKKTVRSQIIGTYHSVPENSFQIYEDRLGKSGWINEINKNEIINKNTLIARLFYTFYNINNDLLIRSWILKIFYFRTYYNIGAFEVYLCNHYIATIDGLWEGEDYLTSETKVFKHRIDPTLDVSNYCRDEYIATLEIRHIYISDKHKEKRANQKVKIVSVEIREAFI